MINNILDQLYYGKITPWENNTLPQLKDYEQHTKKFCELQERIDKLLDGENKNLLSEFIDVNNEIRDLHEEEKFKEGFIIGSKLILEILTSKS